MKPILGTCYYPEHWPASQWDEDARQMAELGLKVIRIGEFAWSRYEPEPGRFTWAWLDQAIETLAKHGLQVVLCTPTATPPRWMVDRHPDMLARDEQGNERKFGSRRHYCFSHIAYREESVRIARLMAERYAKHPAIVGWQIDNEYSCHDTVRSYSDSACTAFRVWLAAKYHKIDALNTAWGNVFWSMEYDEFAQIELPNLTVTEPCPTHLLDFYRFSSDQVVSYNKLQAEAIRAYTDVPLIHNYMGRTVDFDHYKVGADLEIASWDSYPLGFLVDRSGADSAWQQRFERQGDPDFQAFHHDLYRAVGNGRWWVMEQQPGPVNWAPNNPAPLPGMVRLWTWEAIAHQAEAVCYFRWRQAPFAQEQMHAGLLRPDSQPAAVYPEVAETAREIQQFDDIQPAQADVAIVFDYESCWAWEAQPQGEDFDGFGLAFDLYRSLRRLGVSIDILKPESSLDGYKLVLIPGLLAWPEVLLAQLSSFSGSVLIGPRTGSKTANFQIPAQLPPNISSLDCTVQYVETFPITSPRPLTDGGAVRTWLESVQTTETVLETTVDGQPVLISRGNLRYLAGWPDQEAAQRIFQRLLDDAEIAYSLMPEGVRRRATGSHEFTFNYNATSVEVDGEVMAPAAVRWRALD
ncbi:beta-galactosidase [Arenicella xantha]|uniref:Beta-galactosidase n=1 Tax=Arenicella xantha TaxID=644221 RepID=A0A395JSD9_9GAMM|nr:beta-galactosidase [Arenicella xantha]RBP51620.1 beta-galactosidase [Arenicella xantha]